MNNENRLLDTMFGIGAGTLATAYACHSIPFQIIGACILLLRVIIQWKKERLA